MCGIVGYIGNQEAGDLLLTGLKRLEYRGYDSAGLATVDGNELHVQKQEGKVDDLRSSLDGSPMVGTTGIGHTRWATHGVPNDTNAHPHVSSDGAFALVHNGIIENHGVIKEQLEEKGYTFQSETDTEVLVYLIEEVQRETDLSLPEAVRQALTQVVGAYGIAIVSRDDPDLLIAARNGSPLIMGIGEGEYFVGSDAAPLVEHTRQVVYLEDGEMATLRRFGYEVMTIDNEPLEKEIHELEWSLGEIEKGGYDHFMLKEIMEQPDALEDAMRGRVQPEENQIKLGGLHDHWDELREADDTIYVIGSPEESEELLEYFLPTWTDRRVEKGIKIKGVFEDGMRGMVGEHGELADRYLPEGHTSDVSICIYGNKAGIIFWIDNPLVIMIDDADAADSFMSYFDLVWDAAEE